MSSAPFLIFIILGLGPPNKLQHYKVIYKMASEYLNCLMAIIIWKHARTSVLFNDIVNTLLMERRKEMFYLMTHSPHFIYGYMAKDHSDTKRGNPRLPHGLLFPISSKGSFICIIPQTG